jgi:hypothetical protein
VGYVARKGEIRKSYKILVGIPEGNRPLRIPRRRWKENIGMDHRKIGFEVVNWLHLAEDRDQ